MHRGLPLALRRKGAEKKSDQHTTERRKENAERMHRRLRDFKRAPYIIRLTIARVKPGRRDLKPPSTKRSNEIQMKRRSAEKQRRIIIDDRVKARALGVLRGKCAKIAGERKGGLPLSFRMGLQRQRGKILTNKIGFLSLGRLGNTARKSEIT